MRIRRKRTRIILCGAGLLGVALTVGSGWVYLGWVWASGSFVELDRGVLSIGSPIVNRVLPPGRHFWTHRWEINTRCRLYTRQMQLPFAPVVIPVSVALVVASLLPRRVQSSGLCQRCTYDRRGLAADAKCPECGTTPTPTALPSK